MKHCRRESRTETCRRGRVPHRYTAGTVLFAAACIGANMHAFAAGAKAGMLAETIEKQLAAGDLLTPGCYVKNLSIKDGAQIRLEALYEPKEYALIYDANGGRFADGSGETEQLVYYNDGTPVYDAESADGTHLKKNEHVLSMPESPKRDGYTFSGWYLKGNQTPETGATELDGELIRDGSRYMIANDDAADLGKTEHTEARKTVARAIWRTARIDWKDGNEAELLPGGGASGEAEGSGAEDLWNANHRNNHVIEWIDGLSDKKAYRVKHGKTAFQYRRVMLDATTEFAVGYQWYRKAAGESEYTRLGGQGGRFVADNLTRGNNGDRYRCEVTVGSDGRKLVYETELSVYHLPKITGTEIAIDGRVLARAGEAATNGRKLYAEEQEEQAERGMNADETE